MLAFICNGIQSIYNNVQILRSIKSSTNEVQKWKRASLYNRKSVRLSTTEKQPYSAIEEKES